MSPSTRGVRRPRKKSTQNFSCPPFSHAHADESTSLIYRHPCYHGRPMYIRSKDEAMTAMGAILELEGRSAQIIQATVKLALCLDPEARAFMVDVQAAVIEGGLDGLR